MKMLFKSLAIIVVLILLAALALVFLVDANRFKPRIEALAKEQGVILQIKGDLGWDLWPSLGVAVNDVSAASLAEPDLPIAQLQQASLMLKLIPLLGGNFQVDHIAVDGLNLNLKRDERGTGNWESFSKPANSTPPVPTPVTDTSSALTLDIQHISLTNASLVYTDAQNGSSLRVRDINLAMSGVNTRSVPFAVELGFMLEQAQENAEPLVVLGKMKSRLSVDNALENLNLTDGQLQLDVSGKEVANITLVYGLMVKNLQEGLEYQGQVTLKETNLRQLLGILGTELHTANKNALEKFGLSAVINGDTEKIKLENLQLVIDETALNGTASITNFNTNAIRLSLAGEKLNLDDYLPPAVEAESNPSTSSPADDTPLPLETMRALNLNIKLALKELVVNKMTLQNMDAKLLAKNGMLEQSLNAIAYSGKITTKSQLDVRGQQGQLQFDAGVEGLELEPLLNDVQMDSKFGLQGAVQARALGSSQGNSVDTLIKALRANANFSGAQVRLSPINLEQQFCKLVNLVNQTEDPAQAWDAFTEMDELSGSIKWRDQIIIIDTFKAGIEKLQLGSNGKINLLTDEYDIFLPFKLLKDKADTVTAEQVAVSTSSKGCNVGSYYWLERGLELLRCKGSFAEINPLHDCRPDKDLLIELTKDYAVYKVKEKHGAKIDAKKQEIQQKLDDRKQEAQQKIEDKKQQLLDKLQQKLNRGASSSSFAGNASISTVSSTASPQ